MTDPVTGRLRPAHRSGAPRCRTCGVPLFPEEKDYCTPHAAAHIDNTGTAEDLATREPDPDDG